MGECSGNESTLKLPESVHFQPALSKCIPRLHFHIQAGHLCHKAGLGLTNLWVFSFNMKQSEQSSCCWPGSVQRAVSRDAIERSGIFGGFTSHSIVKSRPSTECSYF